MPSRHPPPALRLLALPPPAPIAGRAGAAGFAGSTNLEGTTP